MKSFKSVRNSEDIMRELTAILREMKEPRLHNSLISIVRVDVSSDVSYCKVYISSMSGMESAKEAVKALKNAAGYVRSELGSRLTLRHVPALTFIATDSIEYSANINRILNDVKEDKHDNA